MSRAGRYGFINAKLRARISGMIPREWFMRLADSHSLTEAIAMLDTTGYASASERYRQTGDLKLMEVEIQRLERGDVAAVRKYLSASATAFAGAVLEQFTALTVKNAIRVWFARSVAGRAIEEVVAYLDRDTPNDNISVDAIVNAADGDALVAALSGTPYGDLVEEHLPVVLDRGSLFVLELAIDRWYYQQLDQAVSELDRRDAEVARRLLGIRIDLLNLHWITRIKEFYTMPESEVVASLIPGGTGFNIRAIQAIYRSGATTGAIADALTDRYGDTAALGGETDDLRRLTLLSFMLQEILMHEIHRVLGGYPFTIGIVLAYIFLKQNEGRMITTVINARAYELDPDVAGGLL
jgi:V/A-type H+/Na+-transporting ATPase subunit C